MNLLLIAFLFFVSACSPNPFAKYYQPRGENLINYPAFLHSSEGPKLMKGADIETDAQRMYEDGYGLIGISSFNAGRVNEDQAVEHAKAVHAEFVLLHATYTETQSGTLPLSLPNTQTSTTNLSGTAYGSGVFGSFSGRAKTTTQGTQIVQVPYNIQRYDYIATFWSKLKDPIFGTKVRDLDNDERQLIESNKGVIVVAVVKGSPAFIADILKGDIIKQMGPLEVIDVKQFMRINDVVGREVEVLLWRNGKEVKKQVVLNKKINASKTGNDSMNPAREETGNTQPD